MDREKLKARIRALLQMTTDRGCTEAEAMAAAAKAAELMREAGLDEAQVEMGEAWFSASAGARSVLTRLWTCIASCTNCVTVFDGERGFAFIGAGPGPEIAAYLCDVCRRAIETAEREFKVGDAYRRLRKTSTRKQALLEFRQAMIVRLGIRLRELFAAGNNTAAISQAHAARAAMFGPGRQVNLPTIKNLRSTAATVAGWSAGNDVPLNHGVSTALDPKLIGRS